MSSGTRRKHPHPGALAAADGRGPDGDPRLLDVAGLQCLDENTASSLLSISVHTLRGWRRENRGPRYVKIAGAARKGRGLSGRVVYRVTDLLAFLEATTVPTDLPELPE